MSMTIQSGIKNKILIAQNKASYIENAPAEMLHGLDQQMDKNEDGGFYFMDRIWIPLIGDVRTTIMDKAHATRYSIHPGADKMYHDLMDMYWWPGMKRDIATYKYLADANLHVSLEEIKVDKSLHFIEEPIEIMDRK
nr:putative reverse transcriptase domain-containing protein [Tanacetum cinerariifolium]